MKRRINPTEKYLKLAIQTLGPPILYINSGYDGEIFANVDKGLAIKIFYQPHNKNKYFLRLSKENLIPHIYKITNEYMIMDFIDGETLADIIRYNRPPIFSYEELINIVNRIKKILSKWHKKGFIHGDVTAGNIMFDKKGNLILLDPKLNLKHIDNQKDWDDLEELHLELMEYAE